MQKRKNKSRLKKQTEKANNPPHQVRERLNNISDYQKLILKKIQNLEKSIANFASTSNNKSDNKQKPKADPNKVYSAQIGNSFVKGNKNAKVTIIEWSDYM